MLFAPKYPQSINDPPPYFTIATVLFSGKFKLTCLQTQHCWFWPYNYIFFFLDPRTFSWRRVTLTYALLSLMRQKYSCMVTITNAILGDRSAGFSWRTVQLQLWSMVLDHWCFGDIWVQMAYVNLVKIDGKLNVNIIWRFWRRIFINHHKNWERDANGCSNWTTVYNEQTN